MPRYNYIATLLFAIACIAINTAACQTPTESIKAFNIDYNWDANGGYINSFAKPGLWTEASPAELMQWYQDLGCNVVHSFGVSCNGYAWYKNGIVPEQPGLKYDFLTDMVKLGRKKGMKVFGYFCVGANTKWGLDHPALSYGTPAAPHIPFTPQYLDYLCASIKDAIVKTDMDGVMLDWIWTPSGDGMEAYKPVKWLPCERQMYAELFGRLFPGTDKITTGDEAQFRAKSIARCWQRIYAVVKKTKPSCIIWITCNNVNSVDVAGSEMFRQTDWLMNEAGDTSGTARMKTMVGKQTKLITCLAEWNGQDPKVVVPAALKAKISLYGFTKPVNGYAMPSIASYLAQPVDSFTKHARNIAVLARAFKGLRLDTVINKSSVRQ